MKTYAKGTPLEPIGVKFGRTIEPVDTKLARGRIGFGTVGHLSLPQPRIVGHMRSSLGVNAEEDIHAHPEELP